MPLPRHSPLKKLVSRLASPEFIASIFCNMFRTLSSVIWNYGEYWGLRFSFWRPQSLDPQFGCFIVNCCHNLQRHEWNGHNQSEYLEITKRFLLCPEPGFQNRLLILTQGYPDCQGVFVCEKRKPVFSRIVVERGHKHPFAGFRHLIVCYLLYVMRALAEGIGYFVYRNNNLLVTVQTQVDTERIENITKDPR